MVEFDTKIVSVYMILGTSQINTQVEPSTFSDAKYILYSENMGDKNILRQ
jgi:hypothetical protein